MKKTAINKKLADLITSKEREIFQAREAIEKINAQRDIYTALLTLVPREVEYVSAYVGSINYTWQVRGFNSAKTKKLLEAYIDVADTFGARVLCSSSDSPEYNTRSFEFYYLLKGNEGKYQWNADIHVTVHCELIEGGTACRRVVVGETVEVVKTPQYQFVCK
jgi:hypothetical protein